MVTMPPCHGGDHGFDSRTHRNKNKRIMNVDLIIFLTVGAFILFAPNLISSIIGTVRVNRILDAHMCRSVSDDDLFCLIKHIDKENKTVEYVPCDENRNLLTGDGDWSFTVDLQEFAKGWRKVC